MMKCLDLIKEYALEKNIDIYKVGGAVRDRILHREVSDLDFAVNSNCHSVAADIGKIIGGSYVNMHENTARVVSGKLVLDFSNYKGENIQEDLLKRDFTINSIAVDIKTEKIVDVKNGLEDIKKGIVRQTYEEAFLDDPIRMLRAVRLCGELNFTLDENTRKQILRDAKLLEKVAGERIIDEILKIFSLENSASYIELLDELGLLKEIFPVVELMKKVGKGEYHAVDSYTHSLFTLKVLENNLHKLKDSKWWHKIMEHLFEEFNGRERIATLKLGAFLHDIGKPSAAKIIGDRISFRNHDVTGKEEFEEILEDLPMSSQQVKMISAIITGHMKILVLYKTGFPDREVFKLFKEYKENTIDILLVALFDFASKRALLDDDDIEIRNFWNQVMKLIDRYYTNLEKNYKLISGNEVMELTGAAGKEVGEILRKIEEEIFLGNIKSREDAVEFVGKFWILS